MGPMCRRGRSMITCAALLLAPLSVSFGGGVAAAQSPIRPHQHFIGLVNGSNDNPTVYTVCPGPVTQNRTGPVAGGQTMSVARVAGAPGHTGPFSRIYAWFVPASVGQTPTMLKFTTYGTPKRVPTSIQVPCGGTGKVEFSSCPYLAPCAAGWIPDFVTVTFVDIAV